MLSLRTQHQLDSSKGEFFFDHAGKHNLLRIIMKDRIFHFFMWVWNIYH